MRRIDLNAKRLVNNNHTKVEKYDDESHQWLKIKLFGCFYKSMEKLLAKKLLQKVKSLPNILNFLQRKARGYKLLKVTSKDGWETLNALPCE